VRSLFSTMLVALLGAIVLAVTTSLEPGGGGRFGGELTPDATEAAHAFSRVFFTIAGCLVVSFVALVLIEEKPLRASVAEEAK
jgi:hypothetical protein